MKKTITHGSTFSGIGAPEIAAEMLGWENVFHCEINEFGRRVLDYHYPNSKSYEDITKTDFSEWRGKVTVLTGGFPCQPFSYAGKRRGSEDDRYLWPFMLKCIEQVKPTWFVGENVAGIATMAFPGEDVKVGERPHLFGESDGVGDYKRRERYVLNEIIENLEKVGYEVQVFLVPACAVGAPHRRDRVFIVAHLAESATDTDSTRQSTPDKQNRREGEKMDGRSESKSFDGVGRQGLYGIASDAEGVGGLCGSGSFGREGQEALGGERDTDGLGGSRSSADTDGGRLARYGDNTEQCEQGYTGQPAETGAESCDGCQQGTTPTHSESECSAGCQSELKKVSGQEQGQSGRDLGSDGDRGQRFGDGMLPENRWTGFPTQSPVYRRDDGVPFGVDTSAISPGKWVKEAIKSYGNAIVPQVMYEIFRCIDIIENGE